MWITTMYHPRCPYFCSEIQIMNRSLLIDRQFEMTNTYVHCSISFVCNLPVPYTTCTPHQSPLSMRTQQCRLWPWRLLHGPVWRRCYSCTTEFLLPAQSVFPSAQQLLQPYGDSPQCEHLSVVLFLCTSYEWTLGRAYQSVQSQWLSCPSQQG